MKQFNFQVSPDLLAGLDEMCAAERYRPTRSELVRAILTKAVEDWRRKQRGKAGKSAVDA